MILAATYLDKMKVTVNLLITSNQHSSPIQDCSATLRQLPILESALKSIIG